jgi:hypothetical protein
MDNLGSGFRQAPTRKGAVVPSMIVGRVACVIRHHATGCHDTHPIDLDTIWHAAVRAHPCECVADARLDRGCVHQLGGPADCVLEVTGPLRAIAVGGVGSVRGSGCAASNTARWCVSALLSGKTMGRHGAVKRDERVARTVDALVELAGWQDVLDTAFDDLRRSA